MTRLRFIAVAAITALSAVGCSSPPAPNDGGPGEFDAGNPPPIDGCTGGCAVNQFCDTQARVCKDGCGGCDGGVCQKTASGQFQCVATVTTCNGIECPAGEVACLAGQCSCLGPSRGVVDTCYTAAGQTCGADGKCRDPRQLDECDPQRARCGTTGALCTPVFGEDLAFCTQKCNPEACDRGDQCAQLTDTQFGCLPSGLFNSGRCEQQVDAGIGTDGGIQIKRIVVPVANTCLVKDNMGTPTETTPTGNCTYSFFQFKDQTNYAFTTCRPPGTAVENAACKNDWKDTSRALQCATGLECALTRGGEDGICMRACNARPPSIEYPNPTPSCSADENCVNIFRREDINDDSSVLGVCMKKCDSFANDGGDTCAPRGTVATSCVPTDFHGRLLVSNDGTGICMPQQKQISAVNQPCSQPDPLKGATCGSNQVCAPPTANEQAFCRQVCDTRCNGGDGGMPAFCQAEHNALCTGGKTCTRVTSTLQAYLGFCL